MEQTSLNADGAWIADSHHISVAPGMYVHHTPRADAQLRTNQLIARTEGLQLSGGHPMGHAVLDAESQLRGLGSPLSKHAVLRDIPQMPAPPPPSSAHSQDVLSIGIGNDGVRPKGSRRGLKEADWARERDVYALHDLRTLVVPIESRMGVSARDLARRRRS